MRVTAWTNFWTATDIRGRPNLGIWTLWSLRELLQSKVCFTKVVGIVESDSLDQFLVSY